MDDSGVDPDAPLLEDSEIAANAILDVDIALSQIESFKDDFVSYYISFIIHCVKDVVVVVVLEGCCCISSPSQKKNIFLFWVFRMSLTYPFAASGLLCLSEDYRKHSFAMSHRFSHVFQKKFEKGVMKSNNGNEIAPV